MKTTPHRTRRLILYPIAIMHVIIFEDAMSQQLFPATIVRPAFAINIGTYRLIDLVRRFSDQIEVLVRPHLKKIVMQDCPDIWTAEGSERSDPILMLNARVVPHIKVIGQIQDLINQQRSGVVRNDAGQVICAILSKQNPIPHDVIGVSQLLGIIEDLCLEPFEIELPMVEYPHDIVRHQLRIMNDNLEDRIRHGNYREVSDGVFCAENVHIGEYFVADSKKGPIVIEFGANISPFCLVRGPVYIGQNAKTLEHTAIKDAVTLGATTKVGGEVEGSIIEAYSNKQHHGFLGHSYLGSWVNLGAGTCNSDLKNSYGEVTMEYEHKKIKTGMQFVGCFIGDYAKTAVNTSIFTGKTIGACSMVYGFVTTNVPSFVNYARSFDQITEIPVDVLVQSQARMFARRNVEQRPCDIQLLKDIYEMTKQERQLANEPLSL